MRRACFRLLFVAGCTLLLCTQLASAGEALPNPPKPGTFSFTVRSGGLERTAHVHVPKGYSPGEKPPLVLMLHGAGGNGTQALEHDGWAAMSDKAGFIVVAPDGLPAFPRQPANFVSNPQVWNSGQLRPRAPRAPSTMSPSSGSCSMTLSGRFPTTRGGCTAPVTAMAVA